jgi:hypothetical protein
MKLHLSEEVPYVKAMLLPKLGHGLRHLSGLSAHDGSRALEAKLHSRISES